MADEENPVEPLISKPESYGSVAGSNPVGSPVGLANTMPNEGYCLVFEQLPEYGLGANKDEPYKITQQDGTLKIDSNFNDINAYKEDGWEEKLEEALSKKKDTGGPYDLLPNFKDAGISYYITTDKIDKYFYVIIKTSRHKAEQWADKHKIDMPIDPPHAVKAGRNFKEFHLAHRTYIDGDDEKTFMNIDSDDEKNVEQEQDDKKKKKEFDKLDICVWENIHLPFNGSVKREVYHQEHATVINHRLYLRMLYEMLTDDRPLGGANFIVEKHLSDSYHPLTHFFALRGPVVERPPKAAHTHEHEHKHQHQHKNEKEDATCCESICSRCVNKILDDRMKECDEIRDYYGESVGFYFHFLVHYTKWLYPFSLLGLIWFIIQVSAAGKFGIATPGSTVIVLIAIMWSTFMIEHWYRREWKLRFEWGMMRYKETEVPRPTFSGKIQVSLENAEIIETYKSWYAYCCKITCSMSTMLLCVASVVAIVAGLFILKRQQKNNNEMSIAIGMANSVQIFIMNKLYTWLAYKLNEWEGHRLQQEYYNNLVIKRIIFIVFNSFYSLFYIAFIDDIYDEDRTKADADRVRLEAVRTQLITLFLMAIFLQNTMEILFPWLAKKIAQMCAKKEEEEWAEQAHPPPKQQSQKGLLAHDAIDNSGQGVLVGVGSGGSLNSMDMTHGSDYDVISDIEDQIQLAPSPDVLDNTAEIVILQGYIMLFVIIFPLMPFLASINNYVEFKVDKYNLFNAKRPMPASAAGLGVWKSVLACFNIIAVFSNLGILTFRTPLIHDILGDFGNQYDTDVNLIIFYFCAVLLLLGIIFVIRIAINDQPESVRQAVARQEACERHLLMANMDALAAEQTKMVALAEKNKQKKKEEQKDDFV